MTDSRDEHERYGYTPSVSEGELLGWLRSEADGDSPNALGSDPKEVAKRREWWCFKED